MKGKRGADPAFDADMFGTKGGGGGGVHGTCGRVHNVFFFFLNNQREKKTTTPQQTPHDTKKKAKPKNQQAVRKDRTPP